MKRSSWQIQKAVVFALVLRELKTRFGGRLEGLVWVLFEPMAHIAIMLALKVVLRERFAGVMIDVAVYLVVAMIPFFIFRNIWMRGMGAVDANAGLFGYRQVKPGDAIAARAIMETVMYTMIYVAFVLIFVWMGYHALPSKPLEYMGLVLIFIVMGIGMGLISVVIVKRAPAAATFFNLLSFPLYISSGVLIPLTSFPPLVVEALMWNPMLHLVELSRWAYFDTYQPLFGVNLEYPLAWAFGVVFLGVLMFSADRRRLLMRA
jgi:capsular polysaccharide transport system permease protein